MSNKLGCRECFPGLELIENIYGKYCKNSSYISVENCAIGDEDSTDCMVCEPGFVYNNESCISCNLLTDGCSSCLLIAAAADDGGFIPKCTYCKLGHNLFLN